MSESQHPIHTTTAQDTARIALVASVLWSTNARSTSISE